jgi:predicted PurR-regulated permease PerM
MQTLYKIPFYAKTALIFIGIFALVFTLHIGREIIVPILYATILAIVLNPLTNFLINKRINRILAISIVVTLTTLVVGLALFLISSRMAQFSESYPQLKAKFATTSTQLIRWVSQTFNIRQYNITSWIKDTKSDAISDFALADSLTEVGRVMVTALLLPVYLFMMLYYKPLLLEFVRKLFRSEHHIALQEVLVKTKQIIQTYLVGLFFEMVIMATLNSVGLLLIGIEYAILLGILGALLNIIPYIGGVVATALAMIIAFVTKDSLTYPFLVLLFYLFVQFIDNNYIVPAVVASRVKINALVSVIVVLIGGALWGVSGMFLSIPVTAILKVVFDHIESLKPWGFLLGNMAPASAQSLLIKNPGPLK